MDEQYIQYLGRLYNQYIYCHQLLTEELKNLYGSDYDSLRKGQDLLNEAGFPFLNYKEIYNLLMIYVYKQERLSLLTRLVNLGVINTTTFDNFKNLVNGGGFLDYYASNKGLYEGEEIAIDYSGGLSLPATVIRPVSESTNGLGEQEIIDEVKVFSLKLSLESDQE